MNTQAISLDVSKEPAITPVLYLGQGDKNGTIIEATIYDNGVPLTLTNYSVRFEMRLPDHTSYYRSPNGTVSGNVATIPIDETYAASVDGQTCIAYVVVFSGSNTICSTNRINIIVLESAEEGADAAHAYESGIIEATAAANAAAQSANNAAANASTAATSATTAADNASTQATAAQTAASSANTAASNANQQAAAAQRNADAASTAATAATSSAESANDATTRANAAIDAMGDISELAVPLMTKDTRGGAKLGNSVQLENERLNVKLTGGGSGRSVATESAEALQSLTIHGESIQDGTPTPDAPVEVQTVRGVNMLDVANASYIQVQSTVQHDNDSITVTALLADGWCYGGINIEGHFKGSFTLSATSSTNSRIGIEAYLLNERIVNATGNNSATINIPETADRIRILFYARNTTSGSIGDAKTYTNIQLEEGSTATPYVPYGSIGIVVGDTATPINLQGNTLASLPDGTHDRLLVDSAGHVWIDSGADILTFDGSNMAGWTQQVLNGINYMRYQPGATTPYIVLNASNTMCNRLPFIQNIQNGVGYANTNVSIRVRYTEDTDATLEQFTEWLQSNPLTFIMPRNERQTIDLGYIDMPSIESGDAISVSASIVPVIDATWWERGAGAVADAIKAIMAALEARTGELAEAIADITNS